MFLLLIKGGGDRVVLVLLGPVRGLGDEGDEIRMMGLPQGMRGERGLSETRRRGRGARKVDLEGSGRDRKVRVGGLG